MNFINKTRLIRLFCLISMISMLTSCIYDNFDLPENFEDIEKDQTGNYLEFRISLPIMNTRGTVEEFESYEDEIDLSKVQILFFKADDTFIKQFDSDVLQYIPMGETTNQNGDHSAKTWYVRIPVDEEDTVDDENPGDEENSGDEEKFVETIRKNNFKIAVLANWPSVSLKKGDNLDKLHHLTNDDEYKKSAYTFLANGYEEGMMGQRTSWVKCRMLESDFNKDLKKTSDAEDWIKENWDPSSQEKIYRNYEDLWLIWNFHAALKEEAKFPEGQSSNFGKFEDQWIHKNKTDLKNWLEGKNEDPESEPEKNTNDKTKLRSLAPLTSDNGGFEFIGAKEAYVDEKKGVTGVVLPVGAYNQDAIRFKAMATGSLRIVWGSVDGNTAKLQIERRTIETSENYTEKKEPSGSIGPVNKYEWPVSITGDSEWITIFSQRGNVIIYEIEYIQDKYLYDTDRVGKTPDEQRIPMYGIQQYGALGEVWKEGTTFDLSNFNQMGPSGYDYNDIWLLRSVAKVELLVGKNLKAENLYLRCMNSSARNEPMDISSNTYDIWKNVGSNDKNQEGWASTEWGKIMNQNPFYNNTKDYKTNLEWYYSSWPNITDRDNSPQIINPRILRSDFTEFREAGEDGNYDRFVLYVPEKFVDDPNDVGDQTSLPKVCHIEFRIEGDPYFNLDDNNCYRVYFIEGGVDKDFVKNEGYPDFDTSGEVDKTWEKMYEQNTEYLAKHWPIIRNHIYQFKVDGGGGKVNAILKVLPWKKKDIEIEW